MSSGSSYRDRGGVKVLQLRRTNHAVSQGNPRCETLDTSARIGFGRVDMSLMLAHVSPAEADA